MLPLLLLLLFASPFLPSADEDEDAPDAHGITAYYSAAVGESVKMNIVLTNGHNATIAPTEDYTVDRTLWFVRTTDDGVVIYQYVFTLTFKKVGTYIIDCVIQEDQTKTAKVLKTEKFNFTAYDGGLTHIDADDVHMGQHLDLSK